MRLYHEENLSLSEIADEFGISRQGVHDTLKNAEHALLDYEEKLGLIARMEEFRAETEKADKLIENLIAQHKDNTKLTRDLTQIKEIINRFNG
jgi:hypothetical protein